MADFDDEPWDPAELEAAERLAAALEDRSVDDLPDDAFEAAALLRSVAAPELSDARAEELLNDVLATAREPVREEASLWRWPLVWSFASFGATALFLWIGGTQGSGEPGAASLPPPTLQLLEAQANRLQGQEPAAYERRLREYRGRVLSAMRVPEREGDRR